MIPITLAILPYTVHHAVCTVSYKWAQTCHLLQTLTFMHVHRRGFSCTCLHFSGDIQTNEQTVHVWSSAIKSWQATNTHTHTEVHFAHCSLHLFKQSENKRGRWRLTLHMSKIQRKVAEYRHFFCLPQREGPLTKISKWIKCFFKKPLHLHYIHLPEKSTDLEYVEELAAWTNNDSTF